ncbi:MAG TPA: response regulator [Candidatus Binatia bacterium]|nr:response regulator [Candidatus Binatia bacterium]
MQPDTRIQQSFTIIVIDDDDTLREFVAEVLRRAHYNVLLASGADEAFRLLEQNQVNVVITDLIMPEKEGLETIVELRRMYPKIKIIAMSGGALGLPWANLNSARRLGATVTLTKPFSRQELLAEVARILEAQS